MLYEPGPNKPNPYHIYNEVDAAAAQNTPVDELLDNVTLGNGVHNYPSVTIYRISSE